MNHTHLIEQESASMSQRDRARQLLSTAASAELAAALERHIWDTYHESGYNKNVRRVVAAARRAVDALPSANNVEVLRAFVARAIEPPASVLGRRLAREIRVVRASDNEGAPTRIEPPLLEDEDKLAIYIPNVVNVDFCRKLIDRTERIGYETATMSVTGGGQVHRPDIRDNERAIVWDRDVAEQLWQRLKPHLPASLGGKAAVGLSEKLRFYRYSQGQSFAKHVDDATVLDGQQSKLTLLVYLNESFEGGSTRLCVFDDRFVDRSVDVQPSTGAAFVFDHKILHAGLPVISGIKYALRSDVMYDVCSR